MRELTVQADKATLNNNDRNSLNVELESLISEINHIAEDTQFSGINVLNGDLNQSAI